MHSRVCAFRVGYTLGFALLSSSKRFEWHRVDLGWSWWSSTLQMQLVSTCGPMGRWHRMNSVTRVSYQFRFVWIRKYVDKLTLLRWSSKWFLLSWHKTVHTTATCHCMTLKQTIPLHHNHNRHNHQQCHQINRDELKSDDMAHTKRYTIQYKTQYTQNTV